MKEANHSGTNATDHLRKCKATTEANIASQEKRISAGLLVTAGKFQLCEDVRNFVQQKNANGRQNMKKGSRPKMSMIHCVLNCRQ
jgi:hypothetical protein